MRILKDTARPELLRIKRELELLKWMSVHIGILGDADSDLLMIARVHEYGADIHAQNVKHLAIPLTDEAKRAKSPREFNDLRYVPGDLPGCGFLVRDKDQHQTPPDKKYHSSSHKPKKQYNNSQKDPRPDTEQEWMYMLVESVTIPERSFIRASYDSGRSELETICRDAVDGIIRKGWTAQAAMDYIGKWSLEMTRNYFNTKLAPPKSFTTQLTTTQQQPLFDTGRLFRSITYRVERGGT